MRSPRALIPLLSVCGAAAVVTAAGAGAAIDGLSGSGPAHADGERRAPAVTIKAMTWNVCGGAAVGCPLGARPAELSRRIALQLNNVEVGGRKIRTNVALLQEVCAGQVETLKKSGRFGTWSWAFAPFTRGPSCADGQGRLGVAVGTEAALSGVRQSRLPSPTRIGRVALCGDVASWGVRVCATQFSSTDDPGGQWRRKQAHTLASLAGGGRVVVGGDLADEPGAPALDTLYRDYSECDQGPGPARTGAKTVQDWRGAAVQKTDYLFLSKTTGVSCGVPVSAVRSSDHRPVSAVIRFRQGAESQR
ncbi:endonuclease/exonuclease/phosphatase family protein [Actinomadura roseirufa]|uniref:endonuclease/exonuclease/phosphatase family protein n=1 Tax=Actinomadura roseirufa TaxID=2094049 RepID=UPI001041B56C|nr:endonuclease/exonuclease/phosphatase family protein [Actinomadura roseirufa]